MEIITTIRKPKYQLTSKGDGWYVLKGPGSECLIFGQENAEAAQQLAEENLGNGRYLGADKGG